MPRARERAIAARGGQILGVAREFIGYGKDCPAIRWPEGARIAISLVINYGVSTEEARVTEAVPVLLE